MKFIDQAARFLTRVAAVFLVAMMAINVVDVGLRSSINAPIFGTYEIVELMLAAVAFLAIPEAFLKGEHVTIELIDQLVPPGATDLLRVVGLGATLIFLGLLGFHMIAPALDYIEFNDVTFDLHMPLIWRGSLVLTGVTVSLAVVVSLFVREVYRLIKREQPS